MSELAELSPTFAVDVTPTSWQPSGPMTFDEWMAAGRTLQQIDASINFWLGDWILYGEAKWGERYAQAIEVTGWRYDRLARAKWVASKCPSWLRSQNLSWTCHLNVAHLPPGEQKEWLDKAEADGLSSAELKQAIKAASLPPPTSTPSPNGYGPHIDTDDDVPYSASGPGVWADADEAVLEYEGQSVNDDLPMLSWETMADVRALITAVLLERWDEAAEIAEELEAKIG